MDTEKLRKYLRMAKYFPFERLFPWEEFLLTLWDCTYQKSGTPRWKTLFCMVGRGSGKDGFIAFDSFVSASPYNQIMHYDVDICANNEEQAKRPVFDIIEALENPKNEKLLSRFYYHTKEVCARNQNQEQHQRANQQSKGPGRDAFRKDHFQRGTCLSKLRQHQGFYYRTGKSCPPRVGFFTSNGDVSDGPLDDYLARGRRILFEGEADKGFLPFICCLESKEQVHNAENWTMANPSLCYLPHLWQETEEEYRDWCDHPEQNGDFLTKRMESERDLKSFPLQIMKKSSPRIRRFRI